MTDDRSFDIVLWGATGFTGRLVAEYLADRYDPSHLNWAIAGRNEEKLKKLRSFLAEVNPDWESLSILLGDATDRESLDDIARRTRVVCSTVGPYATYGTDLVAACVEHGTDYCDLTGEIQWIRRMIDRFHEEAESDGTRIVHACGFDSVPSDLGTLMIQEHAASTFEVPCSRVKAFVSTGAAEFSGGTAASALNSFEEAARDDETRRVLNDPYALVPEGERDGPDGPMQQWVRYDEDLRMWTAPFVMALANEKIVRRSNAVLDYPYGRKFRYGESTPTGSGWSGALKAAGISTTLSVLMGAMAFGPSRKLLERYVLPESGEGPDRETRESGSFEIRLVGKGSRPNSDETFRVSGKLSGSRDPGYGSTAWMLGESAVCLALGETNTPADGGILTPASGIGLPLLDRLEETGIASRVTHNEPEPVK